MKCDYEIVKYEIFYGDVKEAAYSEDEALCLLEKHKDENPCIYQIRRMVCD